MIHKGRCGGPAGGDWSCVAKNDDPPVAWLDGKLVVLTRTSFDQRITTESP